MHFSLCMLSDVPTEQNTQYVNELEVIKIHYYNNSIFVKSK